MDVEIELHKAPRPYDKYPYQPEPQDPLRYEHVKHGKEADLVGQLSFG